MKHQSKIPFFLVLVTLFVLHGLVAFGGWQAAARGQTGNEERMRKAADNASSEKHNDVVAGQSSANEILEQGTDLIENAGVVYSEDEIDHFRQAVGIFEQFLAKHPDHFEGNWKCAKACRLYGEEARKRKAKGWKDTCAKYGKKGMQYAQKAIDLAPDKPHGYYYYALCVGTYSDGVGLFTALREGLKDKTQNNLEKVYNMDKFFENGGPIIALGRFWQVVPWPYKDEDKAMEYYREIQETEYFDKEQNVEARIYMAELLMEQWGSEPKKKARRMLRKVPEMTQDPYWLNQARQLLNEL